MTSIESTRFKLSEAQFFYANLVETGGRVVRSEPEAFQYYLSAFPSAARSVGYALQAEEKLKYDAWYPGWEGALSGEEVSLLRNFNRERVATVHKKGANVAAQTIRISGYEYLAAASLEGADIEISGPVGVPLPEFSKVVHNFSFGGVESEVVEAAGRYLELVARSVNDFTKHYAGTTAA